MNSIEHKDFPVKKDVIRAEMFIGFSVHAQEGHPENCVVTEIAYWDFKGCKFFFYKLLLVFKKRDKFVKQDGHRS